ncbi:MAG: HD domain-containing protein [Lachnospiraceae bacterium]|nr:HD domain-containing protein [Lachnospiraceae bacterium]MCI9185650.1 HD domain-containing protein [Lachnospiraceae bacterium]
MITIDEQVITYRKQLKSKLDPMRYEHSLSVSYTCMALAMRYGYDLHRAELAGLLHDCAKRYGDNELIVKCHKHNITLTEGELKAPAVIHAKYGAWMAEHKFGIHDEEILSAIRCHTTGKPWMGMLDKILYIADYIEPRRAKASNLGQMRHLAYQDLDQAMYEILAGTLTYLKRKNTSIDPLTQQAYDFFEELTRQKSFRITSKV